MCAELGVSSHSVVQYVYIFVRRVKTNTAGNCLLPTPSSIVWKAVIDNPRVKKNNDECRFHFDRICQQLLLHKRVRLTEKLAELGVAVS